MPRPAPSPTSSGSSREPAATHTCPARWVQRASRLPISLMRSRSATLWRPRWCTVVTTTSPGRGGPASCRQHNPLERADLPIIHAVILGIVQGLAEFLPISSSGHLIVVPWLFGWHDFAGNPGLEKAFDTALHIGTVIAVVGYFWSDLWRLLIAWFHSIGRRSVEGPEERMAWLLILSAIPGAITGAVLDNFITDHLGQEWLIGLMLVVFAMVLYLADHLPSRRTEAEFATKDAALMGL